MLGLIVFFLLLVAMVVGLGALDKQTIPGG